MEVKEVKEHKKDARRFASSALERGPDWIFLYFIHLLYFLNLMSLQNKKAGRGRVPAGQIIAYCFRRRPLRRWRPGDL